MTQNWQSPIHFTFNVQTSQVNHSSLAWELWEHGGSHKSGIEIVGWSHQNVEAMCVDCDVKIVIQGRIETWSELKTTNHSHYVYVCIYEYVYIYIYVCSIYVCMFIGIYVYYVNMNVYAYINKCIYTYINIYIYIYIYTYACTCICKCICII